MRGRGATQTGQVKHDHAHSRVQRPVTSAFILTSSSQPILVDRPKIPLDLITNVPYNHSRDPFEPRAHRTFIVLPPATASRTKLPIPMDRHVSHDIFPSWRSKHAGHGFTTEAMDAQDSHTAVMSASVDRSHTHSACTCFACYLDNWRDTFTSPEALVVQLEATVKHVKRRALIKSCFDDEGHWNVETSPANLIDNLVETARDLKRIMLLQACDAEIEAKESPLLNPWTDDDASSIFYTRAIITDQNTDTPNIRQEWSSDFSPSPWLEDSIARLIATPSMSPSPSPSPFLADELAKLVNNLPKGWADACSLTWHQHANEFQQLANAAEDGELRERAQGLATRIRDIAHGAEISPLHDSSCSSSAQNWCAAVTEDNLVSSPGSSLPLDLVSPGCPAIEDRIANQAAVELSSPLRLSDQSSREVSSEWGLGLVAYSHLEPQSIAQPYAERPLKTWAKTISRFEGIACGRLRLKPSETKV